MISKLGILFFLFIFLSSVAIAQTPDFEGIITYKANYGLNFDSLTAAQLRQNFGDSLRVYFRGSLYKQHYTNSGWIQEATYYPSPNKYFIVFQKFDTIYSVDCSQEDDDYTVTMFPNDTRKILGYTCIKIVLQGKKSTRTYYYAPALSLARSDFSRHKMGGYNEYMRYAKSAYLYFKIETQKGIQEYTAVKVDKRALPDKVFELMPLPRK